MEIKEPVVHKEKLDRRAIKEKEDHRVKMVLTDCRDLLASRDLRVLSVMKVIPVSKERWVTMVQLVLQI